MTKNDLGEEIWSTLVSKLGEKGDVLKPGWAALIEPMMLNHGADRIQELAAEKNEKEIEAILDSWYSRFPNSTVSDLANILRNIRRTDVVDELRKSLVSITLFFFLLILIGQMSCSQLC